MGEIICEDIFKGLILIYTYIDGTLRGFCLFIFKNLILLRHDASPTISAALKNRILASVPEIGSHLKNRLAQHGNQAHF